MRPSPFFVRKVERSMSSGVIFVVLLGIINLIFTDCSSASAKQGGVSLATDGEEQKAPDIIIAVIDTGIDLAHPELRNHIWTNPGETGLDAQKRDKAMNGIDDDNNGFIDDVHGWNFVNGSNQVSDNHGHGSHVAGVILQTLASFVSPEDLRRIKILPLKYYEQDFANHDPLQASLAAMRYLLHTPASIVNYSGGGFEPSELERLLVEQLGKAQVPLIAAAGNEHVNTDKLRYFPAAYNLPNVISVAATDENGELAGFSNFGAKSVDLAAPGTNIISTLPTGRFGSMSGTSQATAYVTGVAAGLLLQDPRMKASVLKNSLMSSAQPRRWLFEKTRSQGIVQMDRSLKMRGRSLSQTATPINQPNLYLTKEGFRLTPSQDGAELFQKTSPK